MGIGKAYLEKKEYEKALKYIETGIEISKKLKTKDGMKYGYEMLNKIYKQKNDYQKALETYELYKIYADSIFNEQKNKEINKLALNRKEIENDRLEKTNLLQKTNLENEKLAKEAQIRKREIIEKQAEADRLFALAREEKDKRTKDSLFNP